VRILPGPGHPKNRNALPAGGVCDLPGVQSKRYNSETLQILYKGKNIADVLDMRIDEARQFFTNFPKILRLIKALCDVGLGYMTLGQSSTTMSGGEASGSNWPPSWASRERGIRCISSMSRPRACILRTSTT